MSNWWQQKLGAPPTAPQQPQTQYPAQGYPQRPQSAPVAPLSQQQMPQQQYEPPTPGDPSNHMRNIWNWQGNPNGGQKDTAMLGNCPNCNSTNYFSRAGGSSITTQNGTFQPAPECFECGYPRIQGNLPASVTSGVQSSRQAPNAPPFSGPLS